MQTNRDLIQEIIEIKGRRKSDIPKAELFIRLLEIEASYEMRNKENIELLKYFPIALVGCMESYFRLAIKELIDSKLIYLDNASKLASKMRFDFDILKAMHGEIISVGEIISHLVQMNSLAQISSNMSELMQIDFLKEVAEVHDRWAIEVRKEPKKTIIPDKTITFKYVSRTFELRHIFCHETATKNTFSIDEIEKCFDNSILFLKAADEYITESLYPNAPLTQTDMNIKSAEDFKNELSKLNDINENLYSKLDNEQKKEYESLHKAWEVFMNLSADFEGDRYKRGTIRPTIRNGAAFDLTKQRLVQVQKLIDLFSRP